MQQKKNIYIFSLSLFLPLIFYRLVVFFRAGKVSLLREVTGLNVHHYHYGVLLVSIGILLLLFYEVSLFSIFLTGFGLGAMLDGFISSLFKSTTRTGEIINYQGALIPTIILLIGVIGLIFCLEKVRRNR
tara:strand:+ start:117 stop:506 length:390 start_codon:yes stop_codon:yes gene_type:complete